MLSFFLIYLFYRHLHAKKHAACKQPFTLLNLNYTIIMCRCIENNVAYLAFLQFSKSIPFFTQKSLENFTSYFFIFFDTRYICGYLFGVQTKCADKDFFARENPPKFLHFVFVLTFVIEFTTPSYPSAFYTVYGWTPSMFIMSQSFLATVLIKTLQLSLPYDL